MTLAHITLKHADMEHLPTAPVCYVVIYGSLLVVKRYSVCVWVVDL